MNKSSPTVFDEKTLPSPHPPLFSQIHPPLSTLSHFSLPPPVSSPPLSLLPLVAQTAASVPCFFFWEGGFYPGQGVLFFLLGEEGAEELRKNMGVEGTRLFVGSFGILGLSGSFIAICSR